MYRVSLIKDQTVEFETTKMDQAKIAHAAIQKLILTRGNPDREQFCIAMLNAKNRIIGFNIVSTGSITAVTVAPREVFKAAILANADALILAHNHPSNDLIPSGADLDITQNIVSLAYMLGIRVLEHLIINMEDDKYYSLADAGFIGEFYNKAKGF
jgi:DNA repair protein RadC